jgi:hypothetical protein
VSASNEFGLAPRMTLGERAMSWAAEVGVLGGGATLRAKEVEGHVLSDHEAAIAKTVAEGQQRTRLRGKSSTKPADPVHLPRLLRLDRASHCEGAAPYDGDKRPRVHHGWLAVIFSLSVLAVPLAPGNAGAQANGTPGASISLGSPLL